MSSVSGPQYVPSAECVVPSVLCINLAKYADPSGLYFTLKPRVTSTGARHGLMGFLIVCTQNMVISSLARSFSKSAKVLVAGRFCSAINLCKVFIVFTFRVVCSIAY